MFHPGDERLRGTGFDDIADDVRVEEIPRHRATLRPLVTWRATTRSAPTRGERRNAGEYAALFRRFARDGAAHHRANPRRIGVVFFRCLKSRSWFRSHRN